MESAGTEIQESGLERAKIDPEDSKKIAKDLGCTVNEIAQLCAIFQKEPHELPGVFNGLGWSAEKVLKLDRALSPVFIAIKLRLDNGERNGACVAMCLIYDVSKSAIIEELYWVIHGKFPDWLSAKEIWEKFRVNINRIGGNFERGIFGNLRNDFKSVFSIDVLRKLGAGDTPELRKKILDDINERCVPSIFPQKPISEIDIERFGAARLKLGGIKNRDDEQELENATDGDADGKEVCLACSPVIDPVNGKTANELTEGDFIRVELIDGPGMAGVVYRLLNKIEIDTTFPIISSEINESGMAIIKFTIDDGIIGMVRASKEVRFKVSQNDAKKSSSLFAKIIPLFIVSLVILCVVLYYLIK